MKKVIFVGGTSYSGSTLLDMILANDPRGFSCGEVHALFYPWRPHHVNPECGCGDENCNVWSTVLNRGEKKLYETIFDLFGVDFVVDSSKDLFWIQKQMKLLRKTDIEVQNILIWKTPLELAHSFAKRNRLKEWHKSWISYHRAYYSVISEHKTVKYSDLTNKEDALIALCEYIGIRYFPGKADYWNKTHHTLFGNTSAKIHLYAQSSEKFKKDRDELLHTSDRGNSIASSKYRSVYYDSVEDQSLSNFVIQEMDNDQNFARIMEVMESGKDSDAIGVSRPILKLRRLKAHLSRAYLRQKSFRPAKLH